MKMRLVFVFSFVFSLCLAQPSLVGAWETEFTGERGEPLTITVIFSEKHQAMAMYNAKGELIGTQGGTWKLENDILTEKNEFDSFSPENVGVESEMRIVLSDSSLFIPENNISLQRVDDGKPGKLAGAWLFYSRNIKGSEFTREGDHPRKTMKILSGTRFQWIAYDTESREMIASGGGSYHTQNGKYVEAIKFFAKDPTRTGMKLEFDYDLKNRDWRHTGLSSKGDPIDETWQKRP